MNSGASVMEGVITAPPILTRLGAFPPGTRKAVCGRLKSGMVFVFRLLVFCVFVWSAAQAQTTAILPLKQVRAGMKGVGKTVFAGTQISEFDVEILGVLENVGPKQSIILARLSGGPLEKTGVLQGMSGSPVYIDGKLVGAVAMAFPFSKEPIGGIRPIEEMLETTTSVRRPAVRAQLTDTSLVARLPQPRISPDHPADIATPLTLTGFTRSTIDTFAPQLRQVGIELQQGISGGRSPQADRGSAAAARSDDHRATRVGRHGGRRGRDRYACRRQQGVRIRSPVFVRRSHRAAASPPPP